MLGGWPISSSLPPSGSANRARAQLSWQAPGLAGPGPAGPGPVLSPCCDFKEVDSIG